MSDERRRNRQCGLVWHDECSDPFGESCECECHPWILRTEFPFDADVEAAAEAWKEARQSPIVNLAAARAALEAAKASHLSEVAEHLGDRE